MFESRPVRQVFPYLSQSNPIAPSGSRPRQPGIRATAGVSDRAVPYRLCTDRRFASPTAEGNAGNQRQWTPRQQSQRALGFLLTTVPPIRACCLLHMKAWRLIILVAIAE